MIKHQQKAFTLIELLIVIGIIAVLASAVIIAINPGKQFSSARNSTRESHANTLSKALLSYQVSNSGLLPSGITTMMQEVCNTNIPGNPCTNLLDLSTLTPDYLTAIPLDPKRNSASLGTGYWVALSHDNTRVAVIQGLKEISCPTNYVGVPGNPLYGTKDFCVMKYEAKAWDTNTNSVMPFGCLEEACSTIHWAGLSAQTRYQARSIPEGYPWRRIAQSDVTNFDSIQACQAVDSALITNNQWMTIARNIEAQAVNWADGVIGSSVGTGGLFRGNINVNDSASCGSGVVLDALTPGTNCLVGSRNKRTLILSNGETIWDIAGNVYQWTNNVIDATRRPVGNGANWVQWTAVTNYGDLTYDLTRSGNSSWTSTQGIGQYYEGAPGTGNRAFSRGGRWGNGPDAGAFSLALHYSPTVTNTGIGFRCAR
jgi:prepilin-type N-terminal cleavage/methylation domain-containing protein